MKDDNDEAGFDDMLVGEEGNEEDCNVIINDDDNGSFLPPSSNSHDDNNGSFSGSNSTPRDGVGFEDLPDIVLEGNI